MEFIVSFKYPDKVIKEEDLKQCRVWTMDFSEQTRTPIEDTPEITILPENNEIDINQQDKVNLFNNFKLNRPDVIPKVVKESVQDEDDSVSTEGVSPESVQEEPPSSVQSEDVSPSDNEEPPVSVETPPSSSKSVEEPEPEQKLEVSVEIVEDPFEQISSLIKELMEPINIKREKLLKIKDMIIVI